MNRRTKGALILAALVAAGWAGFVSVHKTSAQELSQRQSVACSAVEERAQKITAGFDERTQKLEEAKANLNNKKQAYRTQIDAETSARRSAGDAERQAIYDKMVGKAGSTSAQQEAGAYKQSAEAALASVRKTHDDTTAQYRQNIDTLFNSRQQATSDAIQVFRGSVQSAIDTARTACKKRNPDLSQIRSDFVASLQQARLTFADTRRSLKPTVPESVNQAATQRNQLRAEARAQFERAMQDARQ